MGQAFLYGNGGSGTPGGTLVVTASAGITVTITKDGKTKTKTAGQDGCATFPGLDSGIWTVTAPGYSPQAVEVVLEYAVTISAFAASIAVTYPEGSTCTCSDGTTTLTAPDTSGSYTFSVPNTGSWEIQAVYESETLTDTVVITENGQSESVAVALVLFSTTQPYSGTFYGKNWTYEGSSYSAYMPTVTVQEENVYVVVGGSSSSSNCSSVYNDTKIDFTNKKVVELSYVNTASTKLCITNQRKAGYPILVEVTVPSGTGTVTLDVSDVNESGYVMMHLVSIVKNGSSSSSRSLKITGLRVM